MFELHPMFVRVALEAGVGSEQLEIYRAGVTERLKIGFTEAGNEIDGRRKELNHQLMHLKRYWMKQILAD